MRTDVNDPLKCPACEQELPSHTYWETGATCEGCGHSWEWPILRVEREAGRPEPYGPSYMVWRGNEAIARFSYGYGNESGGHRDAEDEGHCIHVYRRCSIAFMEVLQTLAKYYMDRDARDACRAAKG